MGAGAAKTLVLVAWLLGADDGDAAVNAGYACVKENANDAACWLKLGDALVARSGPEDVSRARVAYGVFLDMAGPKNVEAVRVAATVETLKAKKKPVQRTDEMARLEERNEALIARAFRTAHGNRDLAISMMVDCTKSEHPYPGCLWALGELYRAKNDLVKAERAYRLYLQVADEHDPRFKDVRLRYP